MHAVLADAGRDASVFRRFERIAGAFPDRSFFAVLPETAKAYGIEAEEITYAEGLARIDALANAYRQAGYGRGHRVGLLLQNRPAFVFHWFALNALGASVVPINPDLRQAELEYLIAHSGMQLAVAVLARVDDLKTAAAAAGCEIAVIPPDEAPTEARERAVNTETGEREDECALLYTSGTTGKPKGCVLDNEYFLLAGEWYATVGGLCTLTVDPPERMLTPLPLFHMNAMAYSLVASITVGGCIAVLDRFHPRSWWASVRGFGASVIHYLGVMPAMLMSAPEGEADLDHAVRFGFGAGVDRGLHAEFERRFGFPLLEAWAMTETGAGAVVIAGEEPRQIGTNCFGAPGSDIEVTIVRDDGGEAATAEPGELLVRHAGRPGLGFFREYLKDPKATAEVWRDGWFHTGDVVARDADGKLHFVDRKKNVIRRSGENISAVEVENVLARHAGVEQVAVAATPDPVRGDEVVALVVPGEEAVARDREAAEAIVRFCLTQLAYYKAPGYLVFVDAIPLTATSKIQRGELRQLVETLLEEGRAFDTCALKKRTA
ncbi:AMP-binding protein [Pararhizobium mangrovi]|uniref:ATP-dependent acyl-CoA ligase n=1 Tax=Pararhizobium mangrovi TaxID=2590452 RepID=A0A506TW54_9HYPH|nr:AMP-binding protein [Pararhizobium mangrovi]TPW26302.1 ATP-dependent acyl-CoA ligase [Pararhizobium mangrovi]